MSPERGAPSPSVQHTYKSECILGKGTFGTVYKATVVETGLQVAIKAVSTKFAGREIRALQLLRGSPNIIQFLGIFPGDDILNLVLEYVPDTLQRIIKIHRYQGRWIDARYTCHYMYQLLRGLACLERAGVVHRDLKPANILVDPVTAVLKLCDFGTAKIMSVEETSQPYVCSRYYRAPELIFGTSNCTLAVDVWSAGCVLAEMLTGQPIFAGRDGIDQLQQIMEVLGTPTPEELFAMNPDYLTTFEPPIAPLEWGQVFGYWVPPDAQALVAALLQFSPVARLRPLAAMSLPFFEELRREARRARDTQ
eukprot:CAMPEP_0194513032 /NCGR_PEP_ID=MMETSP0253-20130528/45211_1 /TAXON_ID=2966 /ORGANISM="Noctiluca scintillans" /LENGTH=307 /DNA_ID=CAMNT_0039356547 /DNA_START=60 /DNA_END=980 /DNA_ORIENTATION=-